MKKQTPLMASVDCIIMGRKCIEKISSFGLSPEQWPYGDTRIIVLSNTRKEEPHNLKGKVETYSGDIPTLMSRPENEGHRHAYVDGGSTITHFLNLKLINELTITQAPILLGGGMPLFGKIDTPIRLNDAQAKSYSNDFIQIKYIVSYL